MCTAIVRDSIERPCWTSAILRVRTGESEIGLVCGNDGSKDLPHPHKTITLSLHGYSHSQTPALFLFQSSVELLAAFY